MNKKLIQDQYKKNIDLLSEYDRLYYDISSPKVSDDKYDNLPPHDEAVNHIHFSPAIWPQASNLNEKMFDR